MKIAIMQPYFLPYIGYFQLINAADLFVVYDNIEYTKKGWINRNRILVNGNDEYITLPIKKDSDYLNICDRYLADSFQKDAEKTMRKISAIYRSSTNFEEGFKLAQMIFECKERNLFKFILNSLKIICSYLDIKTALVLSSEINIMPGLKGEDKVIAICTKLDAKQYINSIGGVHLYNAENFKQKNIELYFIKSKNIKYSQFNSDFIPWLSILDVIMFNSKDYIKKFLNECEITKAQ